MLIIFVRSIIIFTTLLILMRLMGKRQIGQMQPFELVITLVIADLACIPMADVSIPLLYGIVAILTLFILHQLVTIIEQGGQGIKKLISGKPSIVINKDGIDFLELKRNNMGVSDLIESLRALGYFSLDDVEYGIFEANGNFSALEKEGEKSYTMPVLLVDSGKIIKKNFEIIGIDDNFIKDIMKENKIDSIKKIQVLTLDANGKIYLQVINKKYKTFNTPIKISQTW